MWRILFYHFNLNDKIDKTDMINLAAQIANRNLFQWRFAAVILNVHTLFHARN